MNVQEAAQAWHAAGASVLPAMRGKRPDRQWTDYQTRRLVADSDMDWSRIDGFGIVTGYGGFAMLEIEGAATHLIEPVSVALAQAGYLSRLMTYMERTPSGGIHWVFRIEGEQDGSQKLARAADRKTLIETRGKYAWTVMAPSGGSIHEEIPNGQWEVINGEPGVVATFTEQEVEEIYDICRQFDELPPPLATEHPSALPAAPGGELTPGQDYDARNTWADILEPLGWTRTPGRAEGYWTRPGKRFGVSASTTTSGNLYVWSSSCAPLEPSYDVGSFTKFRVYSLMEHEGDDAAAARALRASGYGTVTEPVRMIAVETGPPPLRLVPPVEGATALQPEVREMSITLSEDGNARLLAAKASGQFIFVPDWQKFYEWDGARWRKQPDDGPVIMLARDMIVALPVNGDQGMAKHKSNSLKARSIKAVVDLAKSDSLLRVDVTKLDANPYVLNTPSGILNLLTGEISSPDPTGHHTLLTGVSYDPEMPCPKWNRFLAQIMLGDVELIEFIQRLAGYSATGKVTHHVLPFMHGQTGANGKSVFTEVMQGVLGEYASTAPADFLLANGREESTAEARLAGQRFVVCSEVPTNASFNEAKVKRLTGGDRITARFMRQDHVTFTPSHHLWLAGNNQPRVGTGGDSFWRRLRLIPFEYTVPEDERDPELAQKLIAEEGPAILAWIVEGARSQVGGLKEPDTVKAATMGYAEDEDSIGRFLNECVRRGGDPKLVRLNTKRMYQEYETWAHSEGTKPMTGPVFGKELSRRGIESKSSNGQRFYLSVSLLNGHDESRPEQLRYGV